jgi:hypothetical protein
MTTFPENLASVFEHQIQGQSRKSRQFKFEVQHVLMPQRILHEACDSQEIFLVDG